MQSTSELYKTLLASPDSWFEHKLVIDDVGTFDGDDIISLKTENAVMDKTLEIGNAVAGEIDVKMILPATAIPRMAVLRPFIRLCENSQTTTSAEIVDDILINYGSSIYSDNLVTSNAVITEDIIVFQNGGQGTETSEWLAQGVFFIDTRSHTVTADGIEMLTIHGYDSMLKADQEYPDNNHAWPYLDASVVAEIASEIGVTVDSRTDDFLTAGYMINLPVGYTMREVLAQIAAINCGNFIITNDGKLLFVPLYGLSPEDYVSGSYFADENGNALVGGNEGWYILV